MSAVLRPDAPLVRPMREADLDSVNQVEKGAYDFPWSPGIFRDCLRVGYCCWVLEHEGVIKGHGIMQVGGGESHVLNLCISAAAQGRGFGRLLLSQLIRVAQEHGADTVLLEVRPTNDAARHLYDSMGFNEVGIRRAYYPGHGGREDALILARSLAPAEEDASES